MTSKLRYNVYLPYGPSAHVVPLSVPEGATVEDLTDAICRRWRHKVENQEVFLLKVKCELKMDRDDLYDEALKRLNDKRMIPADDLEYYFDNGPAPKEKRLIDVNVATETSMSSSSSCLAQHTWTIFSLEGSDVLSALSTKRGLQTSRLALAQARVTGIGDLPSPSEGVRDDDGIKRCISYDSGVHAHRPADNYDLPTALFHHAPARLKDRLDHIDQLEELEPSSTLLSKCHQFMSSACDTYESEKLREATLKSLFDDILGGGGSWQASTELGKAKPDPSWGDPTRTILELKNESGIGGDASFQTVLVYAKILLQPKYRCYIARSNCPVILIGIMGHRLEISSAVFTDGIYVDKLLSEEMSLSAWKAESVLRLGRILKAVSLASVELRDYYAPFTHVPASSPTTAYPAYLYPDPLPVAKDTQVPRLNYIGKLSHGGQLIEFFRNHPEEVNERPYTIYLAKMAHDDPARGVKVVVKFTAHYNKRAHEILADQGLAPKLHFCALVVVGLHMVVMDYVEFETLYSALISWKGVIPSGSNICRDVKTAMELLHREDLVFGDLRDGNILVKPDGGAMLIDFDWVGQHKKDRYPATWNDSETMEWANGVGRRMMMDKAHDIFMMEKLEKRQGQPRST